jgi:hypothetical protein
MASSERPEGSSSPAATTPPSAPLAAALNPAAQNGSEPVAVQVDVSASLPRFRHFNATQNRLRDSIYVTDLLT